MKGMQCHTSNDLTRCIGTSYYPKSQTRLGISEKIDGCAMQTRTRWQRQNKKLKKDMRANTSNSMYFESPTPNTKRRNVHSNQAQNAVSHRQQHLAAARYIYEMTSTSDERHVDVTHAHLFIVHSMPIFP